MEIHHPVSKLGKELGQARIKSQSHFLLSLASSQTANGRSGIPFIQVSDSLS